MFIHLPASLKIDLKAIQTIFFWRNLLFGGLLLWCSIGSALAQAIVWREDFSGANQGWNTNFTDCDGAANSFAGVRNNRFEAQGAEGVPCCTNAAGNPNGTGGRFN